MNSLRVLLVTPRYLPTVGGIQNHVYQVARRFTQQGVNTTVLTTNPGGQPPVEENSEGLKIRRVSAWPRRRDYYLAPAIYRIIKDGQWDIVHVQSYHTLVAPLAMLAARRANIPYVITFHGGGHSSRLRNGLRRGQRLLLRPLLAQADRLIATAEFEISFFGKQLWLPEDHFALIPNGADLSETIPPTLAAVDEGLIVSIGRLERYKGHHRVIQALPKVLEQQPEARLWIIGAGPYEPSLWKLAHRLNVAERAEIRALPITNRGGIASELSRAALVVLLSEYETQPMAVLEALALGRPVLVADNSGLRELAQRNLAQAIPLNSTPEQVAAAILGQLSQPQAPPGIDLPTWDACAADLLALYLEVIRRRACAY